MICPLFFLFMFAVGLIMAARRFMKRGLIWGSRKATDQNYDEALW